jgi:hypothetical protein
MQIATINNSSPDKQTLNYSGFRLGKKVILIAAVVAVAVIVSALLIPHGAAEIPLNVNYAVGEKMIYNTVSSGTFENNNSTIASKIPSSNNMTLTEEDRIEVVGFDGDSYTLNHTMALNDMPMTFSTLEKMNKTGYSTYIFSLGNTTQEVPNTSVTSSSYLAQLLSNPEVKVGDTVTVPFPAFIGVTTTGDLTLTFKGFENLTTGAGTFKVFRVDMTSNNVSMQLDGTNSSSNMSSKLDVNCQTYLEYGTMRLVKSTTQETISEQSTYGSISIAYTMHLTTDRTLNEDIIP